MPDKKFSDFPYLDPSEVASDDEILILDKSNTTHELGDAEGTMSRTLPEAVKNTGNVASRFIYTPIDFATPGTDIDKVKDAINAMGTLAMERKVYNFYTIRYVEGDGSTTISSDGGPGFDSIIDFYQLLRNYSSLGSGGTQLQGSGYANLRLASRISTRDTAVADNDLGEQGVTDIEDVVNASGPYVTNPGGFNLFTVDRSGVPHRYLYVGEAVNIGDGEVQTTSADWLAWPTTSGEDDGEPDTTPQGYENYVFVQKAYATMAALYAAQADQIKGAVMYVADASAHPDIASGYAYLEYLGTTTGDETDYTVIAPIGDGVGDMLKSTYDPTNVEGDAFDMDNMVEGATTKIMTDAERTKLAGVESGATADQSDSEIETAYNNQVAAASQGEMEAGTEAAIRRMSPLRVAQAIAALSIDPSDVILKDGSVAMTGALKMKFVSVASASNVNMPATLGNYVVITGTTTINSFTAGAAAGNSRFILFEQSLTLTHSANFALPGSADIVTQAGDIAHFVYQGGSQWRCWYYMRADGSPLSIGTTVSAKVKNITSLKAYSTLSLNDFIETTSYSGTSGLGGALYKCVDPTGLTPNDQDIIELNNGQYVQLASKTVNPYMFGAVEEDDTTTTQLQDFFSYVESNDVIGDFSGEWEVDDTITITGVSKEFICGKINGQNNASIEPLVSIESSKCHYKGLFHINGTTSATYSVKNQITGIDWENSNSRNQFDDIYVEGFKGYGAKLHGKSGGSTIMESIKSLTLVGCGSTGSGYPTGSATASVSGVVNSGSANSVSQTSVLTVDVVDSAWIEDELLEINGNVHIIKEISGNDITVYPWVDDSFTGTIYGLNGGALIAGSNSASVHIGQIDAIRCGNSMRTGGLYGAIIDVIQSQNCGIGLSIGYDEASNNLGSVINHLYCENNTYDLVQVTRVDTNTKINMVTEDLSKVFVMDAQSASFLPSKNNYLKAIVNLNSSIYTRRANVRSANDNNTSSSVEISNDPRSNRLTILKDAPTFKLKWSEINNSLFSEEFIQVHCFGTGSAKEPTGTLTFNLDAADQTAGITVMGGTSYTLKNFTKPAEICILFDYDNDNWIIKSNVDEYSVETTGTEIKFIRPQIYNRATPATGNITNDLTDAKLGVVQKIYHNHTSAPSFPAGWVLLGTGAYVTSELNIIYAEWVNSTRVEYWIVQEQ